MISFPNAKINLGLNITSKRPDGYHNLSSCFLPIDWKDVLEIIPADQFEFTSSGLQIPGDINNANICVKSYQLLKAKFNLPAVKIHLHKMIPMGAGLGGGSADGAFTLKMLNDMFELELSVQQLKDFAVQLGADCPFFIANQPKMVTGIGEMMEDVVLDLSEYNIAVVFPDIHVSTQEAFSGIIPKEPVNDIRFALKQPISAWQDLITNDFESTVFSVHPEIKHIKDQLIEQGALFASMTGTGSAVFGIFEKDDINYAGWDQYLQKTTKIMAD